MSDSVTFQKYVRDLRKADEKFQTERDRRYTEVNIEKEKALKIKETADLAALGLAREIQTYKDEKANQLREQINSERGIYFTRIEAKPMLDFIASQQGRSSGLNSSWGYLLGLIGLVTMVIGTIMMFRK